MDLNNNTQAIPVSFHNKIEIFQKNEYGSNYIILTDDDIVELMDLVDRMKEIGYFSKNKIKLK